MGFRISSRRADAPSQRVGIRYSAFGFVSGPGGTRTLRSDRDRISDETSLLQAQNWSPQQELHLRSRAGGAFTVRWNCCSPMWRKNWWDVRESHPPHTACKAASSLGTCRPNLGRRNWCCPSHTKFWKLRCASWRSALERVNPDSESGLSRPWHGRPAKRDC